MGYTKPIAVGQLAVTAPAVWPWARAPGRETLTAWVLRALPALTGDAQTHLSGCGKPWPDQHTQVNSRFSFPRLPLATLVSWLFHQHTVPASHLRPLSSPLSTWNAFPSGIGVVRSSEVSLRRHAVRGAFPGPGVCAHVAATLSSLPCCLLHMLIPLPQPVFI